MNVFMFFFGSLGVWIFFFHFTFVIFIHFFGFGIDSLEFVIIFIDWDDDGWETFGAEYALLKNMQNLKKK